MVENVKSLCFRDAVPLLISQAMHAQLLATCHLLLGASGAGEMVASILTVQVELKPDRGAVPEVRPASFCCLVSKLFI